MASAGNTQSIKKIIDYTNSTGINGYVLSKVSQGLEWVPQTGGGGTLQQVCTNGNTTNTSIIMTGKIDIETNSSINPISIGNLAGQTGQGQNAIAIGNLAGQTTQGGDSIAIGELAGQTTQGGESIAIGVSAGQISQGGDSIAIGVEAGYSSQGTNAIAIGTSAGQTTQGTNAIAIGILAGNDTQSQNAIAIGNSAGNDTQGQNAIAIGNLAGEVSQFQNSIILNASGSQLNNSTVSGFFVKPVRFFQTTSNLISYNNSTSEIIQSNVYVLNDIITAKNYLISTSYSGTAAAPNDITGPTLINQTYISGVNRYVCYMLYTVSSTGLKTLGYNLNSAPNMNTTNYTFTINLISYAASPSPYVSITTDSPYKLNTSIISGFSFNIANSSQYGNYVFRGVYELTLETS